MIHLFKIAKSIPVLVDLRHHLVHSREGNDFARVRHQRLQFLMVELAAVVAVRGAESVAIRRHLGCGEVLVVGQISLVTRRSVVALERLRSSPADIHSRLADAS